MEAITKEFPDVKKVLAESKRLKTEANKIRRKMITLNKKYSFIGEILEKDSKSGKLRSAVISLFIELGLYVDKKDIGNEDFKVYFENRLILVEVKGSRNKAAKEDETTQVSKHINIAKKDNLDKTVTCLLVANYDNKTELGNRVKNPFTERQVKIGNSFETKLITVIELIDLYRRVKTGEITLKQMIDILCTFE